MCECCKNVSTRNDYNPIIEGKISMGFMGNLLIDVFLSRNNEGDAELVIGGCTSTCSDNSFEKKTKINYCPVCGRNFNES